MDEPADQHERRAITASQARRRVVTITIAATAIAATLAGVVYQQDLRHRRELVAGEGGHVVALEREFLVRDLRALHSDLLFLAQQPLLQRLLDGEPGAQAAVEREYLGFSRSKPLYNQVRFLDRQGSEVVRINRRGDDVEVVGPAGLQAKSARYYFTEGMRLEPGEVFVSPLDLNVERGEIELPPNPVIRLVTPVVDGTGERRGLVVLNYAGARLLGMMREIAGGTRGDSMLVNAEGEYLQAPDPGREWGWLLGHSSSFREDHPRAWELIRGGTTTRQQVGDDWFTADWVSLVDGGKTTGSAVAIVSRISVSEATSLRLGSGGMLLVIAVLMATVILAYYWARATVARNAQDLQIAESEARLRTLSTRLLAAQEEERKNLSRVLHDELGQQVTAIALDLKGALRRDDENDPALRRAVEETEVVLASLHQIASRVRPSVLDDLGLGDALESYVSEFEERTGVAVAMEMRLPAQDLPGPIAENIYRIVQEALSNVAAHADTRSARVEISASADALELAIEDDGRGFDAATARRGGRLGILGMRERVELLGGRFALETAPGQGTRIHVSLPWSAE